MSPKIVSLFSSKFFSVGHWPALVKKDQIFPLQALAKKKPTNFPLWGIVKKKDTNISRALAKTKPTIFFLRDKKAQISPLQGIG
jgi:hypothetical protein